MFFFKLFFIIILSLSILCSAKKTKVTYVVAERPRIFFYNKSYVEYINYTTTRYNRRNNIYYMNMFLHTLVPIDNNVNMHFFFYEFRSNEYRRGFIEFKHRWCDFLNKDLIIGQFLAKYFPPCPQPKGVYEVRNVTFLEGQLLNQFPFRKGRIFLNVTYGKDNIRVGEGCIDMEIKQ